VSLVCGGRVRGGAARPRDELSSRARPTDPPLSPPASKDAKRSGVAAEGVQQAAQAGKQLSLKEAQMILGVEVGDPPKGWADVVKRYRRMMDANERHGSFYLQSKVHRARERLEQEFRDRGLPLPPDEEVDPGGGGGGRGGGGGAGQQPEQRQQEPPPGEQPR
jgi:mitochondrial import inner membrane translocase subunit TIM16